MMRFIIPISFTVILLLHGCNQYNVTLLNDNFAKLDTGLFSAPVGPHTEYHYLPEAGIKGNWVVSSFASGTETWGKAWRVRREGESKIMCQTFYNKSALYTHPMIIAGDSLWQDYRLTVIFRPENVSGYSGVAFRYKNDRCFYFCGIKDSMAYISLFDHSENFNTLNQKIIASQPYTFLPGKDITVIVDVRGNNISAELDNDVRLEAQDNTYAQGKIGLVSNAIASYKFVEVVTSEKENAALELKKENYERIEADLQSANPQMKVWKKIRTDGFGVGRNLRFGDLDNDNLIDVLIGQVVHHNWPRDSHSELSCLTAMTFDGKILWQKGDPDPEKTHLTNDVGFQVHDINNDGKMEVIYCMNFEIIVADGSTGKTLYKAPAPKSKIENDKFERILGDCLFFFDSEGKGWDSNLLIKDRYTNFWVLDSKLRTIWEGSCKTGHYPFAEDIDGDGKDELAIGYSLYDHEGTQLWCLDSKIDDHSDGVAVVSFNDGNQPMIMYAASNAGYLRTDLKGNIQQHYFIGHVQNPSVADFRPDLPGLETVSINFWGNQGILHFYDSEGKVYLETEPNQFGSMCLPLNWTGKQEEFFIHNPSIKEGGVYDGSGRKVLLFPDDGHPDMCNAVLDITGDCRDEIIVWNPSELWVYTQEDNPRRGRLYKPVRNPLYNYSNYQATVSLPAWNDIIE